MNIGVVGAGAVGGFFGAKLRSKGNHVSFLARGRHLEAMKKGGLKVDSESGVFTVDGQFTNDIYALADADLLLFCVKSTDTEEIALQLKATLKTNPIILTMQNGVENEEILSSLFGKEQILSAATYVQADIESPGVVKQRGRVALVIGKLEQTTNDELAKMVVDTFEKSGVETKYSSSIIDGKWRKLLWNVTFNPLSAASKAEVGEILDEEHLKITAEKVCREAIEVATKTGVTLREDMLEQIFRNAEKARNHKTSMLQDRIKGKRMEVEALCGYIVRKGSKLNVETPAIQTLYSVLKFIDRQ